MSKLAKLLMSRFTGDRSVVTEMSSVYSCESITNNYDTMSKHYLVEAKFKAEGYINESIIASGLPLDLMARDLRQKIIEEVFGEFRPYIVEMKGALYNRDTIKLRELLKELEYKMFVEGLGNE